MAISRPFLSNDETLNTPQGSVSHLKRIPDTPGISASNGHLAESTLSCCRDAATWTENELQTVLIETKRDVGFLRPRWVESPLSRLFQLRCNFIPDFRLIDYSDPLLTKVQSS